jgi:glycerophosphoryl diester phosphodiesterase
VSNFLLIAKAGGSGEAAENTCEAISRSAGLRTPEGVELAIEVDLRLSAECQLVALHDSRLERTTDGHGPVRQRDVQTLRRLKAGSCGERVPTLLEVLEAAGERPLLLDLRAHALRDQRVDAGLCRSRFSFQAFPCCDRAQWWLSSRFGTRRS